MGSLVAALASYLDARAQQGSWLLRIEDLDAARTVPGAAQGIIATLAALGMESDAPVVFQSSRVAAYGAALRELRAAGLSYDCSCTRRELAAEPEALAGEGNRYPGNCRAGPRRRAGPYASRLRVEAESVTFTDRLQGPVQLDVAALGDPVISRRDGIVSYQLAVVVDDAWQGVSHVVRGADLLPSTGWQILLQRALHQPTTSYLHLPLVVEADGSKLAKSRHSVAVAPGPGAAALWHALNLLRQEPPVQLQAAPPRELLDWAVRNWQLHTMKGIHLLPVNTHR